MSFLSWAASPVAAPADEGPGNPWFSWGYIHDNADILLTNLEAHAWLTARAVLIALVVALPPAVGTTTDLSVLIALVLYALLVLVRNTLAGLTQVPDEVRDAAAGMGYGKLGRLWRIELPLALPGILTGLRLATVSTVALVTVGSLIGKGGLGNLILGGFQNNFFKAEILTGTVLCVLLALLLDLILIGAGRLLTPWTRRAR